MLPLVLSVLHRKNEFQVLLYLYVYIYNICNMYIYIYIIYIVLVVLATKKVKEEKRHIHACNNSITSNFCNFLKFNGK